MTDERRDEDDDKNYPLTKIGRLLHGTIQKSDHLGGGSYGDVYKMCKTKEPNVVKNHAMQNCRYAVKISQAEEEWQWEKAKRDCDIMQHLAKVRVPNFLQRKPKRVPVAPAMLHQKEVMFTNDEQTQGYFIMTLERFDGNMSKLTQELRKPPQDLEPFLSSHPQYYVAGIYTQAEWNQMRTITNELSNNNVVHGDLKPDQFLFRFSPKQKTDVMASCRDIVVTDFGFSGLVDEEEQTTLNPDMGWPCIQDSIKARRGDFTIVTKKQAWALNLWQLYIYHLNIIHSKLNPPNRKPTLRTGIYLIAGAKKGQWSILRCPAEDLNDIREQVTGINDANCCNSTTGDYNSVLPRYTMDLLSKWSKTMQELENELVEFLVK